MTFTNIDPKAPNDPFYFIEQIDENGKYNSEFRFFVTVIVNTLHDWLRSSSVWLQTIVSVLACEPEVKNLNELLQKLNETNNFRSFVICIHRAFKSLVSS